MQNKTRMRTLMKRRCVPLIKASFSTYKSIMFFIIQEFDCDELTIDDSSKSFFIAGIFVRAVFRVARFHPLFELIDVANLCLVMQQCLELDVPCVGDIDDRVWLHG